MKQLVTIIIPVKNEQDKIVRCIESFGKNSSLTMYFIIVDDNSEDNTFTVSSDYLKTHSVAGEVVKNTGIAGAGVCRNLGITLIPKNTDYVLFFDADDTTNHRSLTDLAIAADKSGSDMTIGKYNYCISADPSSAVGMLKQDQDKWAWALGKNKENTFPLVTKPYLIETVNYPWNKLFRYGFLKKINLRFSETIVNNDIFAHWQSFIMSDTITLVDTIICNHFVIQGQEQITTIFDKRRFVAFIALNEVDEFIRSDEHYYEHFFHLYLKFKVSLLRWMKAKLPDNLISDFNEKVTISYQSYNSLDTLKVSLKMPNVAADAALYRIGHKV